MLPRTTFIMYYVIVMVIHDDFLVLSDLFNVIVLIFY